MVARGYGKSFGDGADLVAERLGILIPPSIPMVLYGAITGTSVASLFMAGFVPGLLMVVLLIVVVVPVARWKKFGSRQPADWPAR